MGEELPAKPLSTLPGHRSSWPLPSFSSERAAQPLWDGVSPANGKTEQKQYRGRWENRMSPGQNVIGATGLAQHSVANRCLLNSCRKHRRMGHQRALRAQQVGVRKGGGSWDDTESVYSRHHRLRPFTEAAHRRSPVL